MKTNYKKLIVGAMGLVVGAGLVGSISGSVAWYQYSTRATAAFIGTAAHCSENMQIKVAGGEWRGDYTVAQSSAAVASLAHNGSKLTPLTTGAQEKNTALGTLYKNPVYQKTAQATWGTAADANYLQFTVSLRVLDVDGSNSATYLDKDVYLTNLTIRDVTAGKDLSDAVRVHIANSTAGKYALAAKTATSTVTAGKLDLNNDGAYDKAEGYEWDTVEELTYGDGTQTSFAANDPLLVADDSGSTITGGVSFGKTGTSADGLSLTITIWLEGWAKLDQGVAGNKEGADTAVWDAATYVGKQFNVGMRFAVDHHADH